MKAQGATEYLVLLAVVLIISLVGIALLGFFPGTATEAQASESQIYWKSASPIAITETTANIWSGSTTSSRPYIRVKNSGQYPIRITALIGADGGKAPQFYVYTGDPCIPVAGFYDISQYFYLGPGEEGYFGWPGIAGITCRHEIYGMTSSSSAATVGGASSLCQNSSSAPGTLVFNSFGFEYVQYIEGQQVTKRQTGKPLIIKCIPPG